MMGVREEVDPSVLLTISNKLCSVFQEDGVD